MTENHTLIVVMEHFCGYSGSACDLSCDIGCPRPVFVSGMRREFFWMR